MVKIKFTCNWTSDQEINKRVKSNFISEDNLDPGIEITDNNDYDFLFVFNKLRYNPIVSKNRIYTFIMEPSWSPNWDRNCFSYSNKVFTHDKNLYGNHENIVESPSFMFYHMDHNKHTIKSLLENKNFDKKKKMSMVVSYTPNSNGGNYGKRTELALKLLEKGFDVDIYGNGWNRTHPNIKGSLTDKYDGLIDYQYSIAVENSCEKNYLTEKYFDISLCNGVPIYYGSPNVDEIYRNHINLNLNDINDCLDNISDILRNDKYDVEGILENKNIYFNKFNIYNKVKDIIKNRL
jgi:hypothetical protein